MAKKSAGVLMYRWVGDSVEIFLVHPGGPLWSKKDLGSWSIPKGEYEAGEDPLTAAAREFREETGFEIEGKLVLLATVRQSGGKLISAFAVEGTCDPSRVRSGHFLNGVAAEVGPEGGVSRG